MTDTSLPQVRSWPWMRGYQAHFKQPGGSWQFVRDGNGKPVIYATSEAAKDAATALVFRFMCQPIVAERPAEDADPVETKLIQQRAAFQSGKAAERAAAHRLVRQKGRQRQTVVETKRRRG